MQIVGVPEKLTGAPDNFPLFYCEQSVSSSVSDLSMFSRADGSASSLRGVTSRVRPQMSYLVSNM
jgi:hypothetical protein